MNDRCPATFRYTPPNDIRFMGLQCKFAVGHDGDHCGYTGTFQGDVFWPNEKPTRVEIIPLKPKRIGVRWSR